MDASIDAITKFSLNQFSGRYMLHLLARFTSYVNVRMGNPSQFDVYVDRKRKGNTYDIEHILPDDYDSYSDEFQDAEDFQTSRQMIGNLIRDTYGGKIKVFSAEIPHSVRAAEISAEGKSIFLHDPGGKVAEAYRALTKEVMQLEAERTRNKPDPVR